MKKNSKKNNKLNERWKCAHCSNDLPEHPEKCGFCGFKICGSCTASNCPKKGNIDFKVDPYYYLVIS
ncbi:MAG: hypothetical protein AB1432_14195 [Bacteroidota bacterium]